MQKGRFGGIGVLVECYCVKANERWGSLGLGAILLRAPSFREGALWFLRLINSTNVNMWAAEGLVADVFEEFSLCIMILLTFWISACSFSRFYWSR